VFILGSFGVFTLRVLYRIFLWSRFFLFIYLLLYWLGIFDLRGSSYLFRIFFLFCWLMSVFRDLWYIFVGLFLNVWRLVRLLLFLPFISLVMNLLRSLNCWLCYLISLIVLTALLFSLLVLWSRLSNKIIVGLLYNLLFLLSLCFLLLALFVFIMRYYKLLLYYRWGWARVILWGLWVILFRNILLCGFQSTLWLLNRLIATCMQDWLLIFRVIVDIWVVGTMFPE
jgi:hypothetical protein